jgi:AcrR family transcriptional regulator
VPSLRDINKTRRRGEILKAAAGLVAREGVDALSMRKLADAAGTSVATLYNLFGSRADILLALVADGMDRMDEALEATAPADPLARAEAIVSVTIDYVTAREAVYKPVWLARRQTESKTPEGRSLSERAADMQRAALTAAIEAGLLRSELDPTLLGMQIFQGWVCAADVWAEGEVDAAGFKAKALYALYVCLLSVATDETRPMILDKMRTIEQAVRLGLTPEPASRRDRETESPGLQ